MPSLAETRGPCCMVLAARLPSARTLTPAYPQDQNTQLVR